MNVCKVERCEKMSRCRGYCWAHYMRERRHGNVGSDKPLFVSRGIRKHRLYSAWAGMKNRCHNPNNSSYPMYGGRGIVVCDRWQADFAAFLADMGERPEGMTLDRIDANGPYAPENCRWATPEEQRANWSAEGAEKQRSATSAAAKKRWDKYRSSKAAEV